MMSEETAGFTPPAKGVIVSATAEPTGFNTDMTELTNVVVTKASPAIADVPVARPTTV
ncbi:MAG: hypothetical protein Q7R41_18225 [Phycisphaerales bacterium]|nr:hypothetical protein [Phycisphaerales bacterium]